MASILPILIVFILLQASVKTAPDGNLLNSEHTGEGPKLDSIPNNVADQSLIENENEGNQRQKRFYDYVGFGYSQSRYPSSYPFASQSHYSKRDESQNTAVYGEQDPFSQILTRLREIVFNVRQYSQPAPQPASIPAFIPFLYIPPFDCGCSTDNEVPSQPVDNNNQPINNNNQPTNNNNQPPNNNNQPLNNNNQPLNNNNQPLNNNNQPWNNNNQAINNNNESQPNQGTSIPDFPNRVLEIDDNRRNWGTVINNTSSNESNLNIENDGNRPVSFDPVIPQTPIDIPVPPVEHGSVQEGAEPQPITTTTARPMLIRPAKGSSRIPASAPSTCDTALVSCCLRSQVTPNCFAEQGCPDPSIYGTPCNPEVILNVLNKVQHYIKQISS